MIGEMYGDFSRLTFAPEKHFSAVLVQQGRVTLDADANEQTALTLHYLRRLVADVVGRYGGPDGATGFAVTSAHLGAQPNLGIGVGRYYVNGLLCEVDSPTTYFDQADAYLDPDDENDALPDAPYVVYLRAWERQITALEDPSIREVGLGENGPDTAARAKIVWQVRASADWPPQSGHLVGDDRDHARQRWEDWEADQVEGETTLAGTRAPSLRARARQPLVPELDPCIVSPAARYRGLENQLYRVEIHDGGTEGDATFKWSRDNGCVVFPLESLYGTEATVTTLGRDRDLGVEVGDWLEVLDDRAVLRGVRRPLRRVEQIDILDRLITFETDTFDETGSDPTMHPFLRRWDQQAGPASAGYATLTDAGVLRVREGVWIELEDGVQIAFEVGGNYTPGDFWIIPARTATGDVEWPQAGGSPAARPPSGIGYAYAPLAYVNAAGDVSELRSQFAQLAKPMP